MSKDKFWQSRKDTKKGKQVVHVQNETEMVSINEKEKRENIRVLLPRITQERSYRELP